MFVTLWEYEVKPSCEERFEKVYGPEGDWAKLFRSDGNYLETRLLRDVAGRESTSRWTSGNRGRHTKDSWNGMLRNTRP